MKSAARRLRDLIARDIPAVVPLAMDPLGAKLAQRAGFEALYLGGGALGYSKTFTEAGLSLTQLAQTGLEIGAASDLPLILDGACGFGDAMHLRQTIAVTEAAGFAAIEIEDQLMPKRAHHHIGIEHLIPTEQMVAKIRESVAARRDPDFLIIARTNACRTNDLDEAVRRCGAYKKAGADMLFVLPKTPEEARAIGERIEGPLFYMILAGWNSIGMSLEELGRLGYRLVCDSQSAMYAAHKAMRLSYEALARGLPDPTLGDRYNDEVALIQNEIGLEQMLEIERRTVEDGRH